MDGWLPDLYPNTIDKLLILALRLGKNNPNRLKNTVIKFNVRINIIFFFVLLIYLCIIMQKIVKIIQFLDFRNILK